MNIAIVVNSQGKAQDLITGFGLNRRRDGVRVFTRSEHLQGLDFGGWLVITETQEYVVPVGGTAGRMVRYKLMELLK